MATTSNLSAVNEASGGRQQLTGTTSTSEHTPHTPKLDLGLLHFQFL